MIYIYVFYLILNIYPLKLVLPPFKNMPTFFFVRPIDICTFFYFSSSHKNVHFLIFESILITFSLYLYLTFSILQ